MRLFTTLTTRAAAAALSLAACWPAHGQAIYRCGSPGNYSYSNQPCPGAASSPAVQIKGSSGGGEVGSAESMRLGPSLDSPAAFGNYLSPDCAQLYEALRTANSRGLKQNTVADLRREWTRRCAAEGVEAFGRYVQDVRKALEQQRDDRQVAQAKKARAETDKQQCAEMRRILMAKRNRPDMNEGEKVDLKHFEDNYNSRCG